MTKRIKYESQHVEQAKAEGGHLVTLDITGTHAKKTSVSWQGVVLTPEDVQHLWDTFEWLAIKRHKKG